MRTFHFDVALEPDGIRLSARRSRGTYVAGALVAVALLIGPLAAIDDMALWGLPVIGLPGMFWAMGVAPVRSWRGVVPAVHRSLRAGLREARDPTYREPAAERFLEIDGREVPAGDVRDVQVRPLGWSHLGGLAVVYQNALFIVLSEATVLVELQSTKDDLVDLAGRLREALGLPAASEPLGPTIALRSPRLTAFAGLLLALFAGGSSLLLPKIAHTDMARTLALGSGGAAALLVVTWAAMQLIALGQRNALRSSVPAAVRSPTSAPVPLLPGLTGLRVSQDAGGLHVSSTIGRRWVPWIRRSPAIAALGTVLAELLDERLSLGFLPLLFIAVGLRWALDRSDQPSSVWIAPPQGHEGTIDALLDVDGRRWPVDAVREVVVGAIPHPRVPMWFPVYIVLPGKAIEVGGSGERAGALALAALLRTALRLAAVADDRPRRLPGAWTMIALDVAFVLAIVLAASLGMTAILLHRMTHSSGGLVLTAGIALGLLAIERTFASVRLRAKRGIARRLGATAPSPLSG